MLTWPAAVNACNSPHNNVLPNFGLKEAKKKSMRSLTLIKYKSPPVAEPTNELTSQVQQVTYTTTKLSILYLYLFQFPPQCDQNVVTSGHFVWSSVLPQRIIRDVKLLLDARQQPSAALHCTAIAIARRNRETDNPRKQIFRVRLTRNAQSTCQIPTASQQPQSRLFNTPRRPT